LFDFLSVRIDYKQYTNSISDLIVITVFFILHLNLTIGLIHVIAQQIQKIRACIVAWRKVLPTEKSLVVSFWTFFKFLGNQGELERTEATTFLLMQGYLSKVILQFF